MRNSACCLLSTLIVVVGTRPLAAETAPRPQWLMNATIIEACSCPMFCQCYFDTKPASHAGHGAHGAGGEHFCQFNNAFRVNTGHWGDTKLDGAKFWLSGDLGGDFTRGMDWAVLTFDPAVTKEQRNAIAQILTHVYPVKWNSFTVASEPKPIEWSYDKDHAVAKMDGGKAAEVVLKRYPGNTDDPIVITNLRYFGVPRNTGFVLMPNQVQAFREVPDGRKAFEFRNSNGFMITIDMNSNDVAKH